MEIHLVAENKKQYLDLLLLGDEQESMIDRYLERGDLYALYEGDVRAIGVVTDEGEGAVELKNLAVPPQYQRMGYGGRMVRFLLERYRSRAQVMLVGTGDSPLVLPFYKSCGFTESHRVKNFFLDNYDHPIIEGGQLLTDMVYLKQTLVKERAALGNVMVDCGDAGKLQAFYGELLGWEQCALFGCPAVRSADGVVFLFAEEPDYAPPVWPEESGRQQKQMHFDFQVEDVAGATERALSLGAQKAGAQFGGEEFTTLLDPAGHPFCLCRK